MSPYRASCPHGRAVTSHDRAVRPLAVLLVICCCLSAASGRSLQTTSQPVAASRPGFDPKDVVREVRSRHSATGVVDPLATGFDDGEFLLDISGRKVLDLHPGANDVRALAPGVYFLRGPRTADGSPDAAVRRVVVTR